MSTPQFESTLLRYDPPSKVKENEKVKDRGNKLSTDEILNRILPPRSWSKDGELWVQNASSTPATVLDLVQLQEKLDAELRRRQARETGICPVREDLYNSFFGVFLPP